MKILLATALLGITIALPAKADIVTYNFTAKINALTEQIGSIYNPQSVSSVAASGETISLGNTLKASFTYRRPNWQSEPRTGDLISVSGPHAASTLNFAFDQNNFRFNSNESWESTVTHTIDHVINYLSYSGVSYQNSTITRVHLGAFWKSDIFSGNTQFGFIPLSNFNIFSYDVYDYSDATLPRSFNVEGQLTSLELASITPVPEPRAYLMLLAGLAGVGLIARRRQTHH